MSVDPRKPVAKDIWKEVDATFIGFNEFFDKISGGTIKSPQNYPPYNIITDAEGSKFGIEIATAGFSLSELTITLTENKLLVVGEKSDHGVYKEYTHKGIASRNFELTFSLADGVEVEDTLYKDGLLRISLVTLKPTKEKLNIPIKSE